MPYGARREIRPRSSFRILSRIFTLWMAAGILVGWALRSFAGPSALGDGSGVWPTAPASLCPPGECKPKASTFGYYRTQWRVWPGERRPDRFFPQSIGLEAVPTPGPEPIPELPRQKITPEKPSPSPLPKLPTELPLVPPEEKPLPPTGPSQSPILPSNKPVRIEDRSPLESVQPTPLEPIPPGKEKPSVQMPLPLEPLPGGKPSGAIPTPSAPGPSGSGVPLPGGLQPPGAPPNLPSLPVEPPEKPSASGPNDSRSSRGSSRIPSDAAPAMPGQSLGPFQPEPASPPSSSVPKGESSSPPASSSSPPPSSETPEPKSSSWDVSPPEGVSGGRPESRASRSPSLADPLEPWAEPKPWYPSRQPEVSPSMPTPEAPPIEASWPSRRSSDRAAQQAVFQADLPPASAASDHAVPTPQGPYGLDGYCPVTLLEKEQWTPGDPRFAVQHQGKVYLLAGPSQRQRFLANPLRYIPVGEGVDPVLAVEENRRILGRTDYCAVYDGRLYLFSSSESLARFHQNPKKYASSLTRPGGY